MYSRCRIAVSSVVLLALAASAVGCSTRQVYSTSQHQAISLSPGDLDRHGVAIITPSSVTGQEEDKEALALTFAEVLRARRPAVKTVTLAETLGAINRNGLARAYKQMYDDYQHTGIFKRQTLQALADHTQTRYLLQLKLGSFGQGSSNRWGILGVRVLDTQYARIRLFVQIWDAADGSVAWEGVEELDYAFETTREQSASFREVVSETAGRLIARLP
jgi:hypothetical protein